MRGYIHKRRESWQITVYIGTGPDGKYRRHFKTIRGRKSDAQKRLNKFMVNPEKGIYTTPRRLTEHPHQWLEGYVKTNCSQRTLDGYQSIIERHLIPAWGILS